MVMMSHSPQHAAPVARRTPEGWVGLVATALAIAAIVQGVFYRLWFIGHIPINSDEAVTGLIARAALHGHVTAFYWGQNYGGVEPFLDAVAFTVFPSNGVTLHAATAIIGLIGAFLLWRCARRLVASRPLALSVTAVAVLFPTSTVLVLTQAYGFRATEYALSFGLLLAALAVDRHPEGAWRWLVTGLVAGLGWWCSPEIVYIGIAAGLVVLAPWWQQRLWAQRGRSAALLLGGFAIGSLPWWWYSFRTSFDTLHSHNAVVTSYGERLSVFFSHVLPQLFGFQQTLSGDGLGISTTGVSHTLGVVVICVVLVAAALSAILAGGPRRALGIAVLVSPFAYAASPVIWYFVDGRYAIYLLPLYALVLAIGLERLASWRRLSISSAARRIAVSSVAAIVLVGVMVWSSWQFSAWSRLHSGTSATVFSGFSASDGGEVPIANALVRSGHTVGWAGYWVAYRLDFLGGGALSFSPPPNEPVRSVALLHTAMRSPDSVWLVTGRAVHGRGVPRDHSAAPGGIDWGELKHRFTSIGVTWRIDRVGSVPHIKVIDGTRVVRHFEGIWVIIPSRRVLPAEIGMTPSAP
jgi:Dolichyl-phosphate-mannose-protein mannosyltransferase